MPSMPTFWRVWRVVIINRSWILSKAFSAPVEIIIWFLFFSLLMGYITLIDLWQLNNPCIPGINPTLSWCMILLICWLIQFADALLSIFARRSNQSILNEISPAHSLEGLILNWSSNTLATWCEELTHWKILWCWERLKAGGKGDDRGWDSWMDSMDMSLSKLESSWWTGRTGVLQSMGWESQTWLSDWTEGNWMVNFQRYKLGWEKAEETQIELSTFTGF